MNQTPSDTQYQLGLIRAHVPEAGGLTFEEAFDLATRRDEAAAKAFVESVQAQLEMDRIAAAINQALDLIPDSAFLPVAI